MHGIVRVFSSTDDEAQWYETGELKDPSAQLSPRPLLDHELDVFLSRGIETFIAACGM